MTSTSSRAHMSPWRLISSSFSVPSLSDHSIPASSSARIRWKWKVVCLWEIMRGHRLGVVWDGSSSFWLSWLRLLWLFLYTFSSRRALWKPSWLCSCLPCFLVYNTIPKCIFNQQNPNLNANQLFLTYPFLYTLRTDNPKRNSIASCCVWIEPFQ